ncbi:hypothetical protein, partial [Paenibacillus timonensis]
TWLHSLEGVFNLSHTMGSVPFLLLAGFYHGPNDDSANDHPSLPGIPAFEMPPRSVAHAKFLQKCRLFLQNDLLEQKTCKCAGFFMAFASFVPKPEKFLHFSGFCPDPPLIHKKPALLQAFSRVQAKTAEERCASVSR